MRIGKHIIFQDVEPVVMVKAQGKALKTWFTFWLENCTLNCFFIAGSYEGGVSPCGKGDM